MIILVTIERVFSFDSHGLIRPQDGHKDLEHSLWFAQLKDNITFLDSEPLGEVEQSGAALGLISTSPLQLQPPLLVPAISEARLGPSKSPLVDSADIDLVSRVWTADNRREVILELPPNSHGGILKVTAETMGRLANGRYLDDNIIEAECFRRMSKFKDCELFPPFFMTKLYSADEATGQFVKYDYPGVKGWVKPGSLGKRILCCTFNKGRSHWTCIIADTARKCVFYYDSKKAESRAHVDAVVRLLGDMEFEESGIRSDWTPTYLVESFPDQHDACNCGVFMLICLQYWCLGAVLSDDSFDSFADIQAFRTRITLALVRAYGNGNFLESRMD